MRPSSPLPNTDRDPPVIAIAAGSTGGHRHIGQAIGEAYQKACPAGAVLFISSTEDSRLPLDPVPGWHYARVPSAPFTGQRLAGKARSLRKLFQGFVAARRLLRTHRVQVVIGCGSFASVAVVLAARSLGVPTAVHEANRVPGKANRLVMGHVDRILLGLGADPSVWSPRNGTTLGNPIREKLARAVRRKRETSTTNIEILVMGGSQGSAFLNAHVPPLMGLLAQRGHRLRVWHQVGEHSETPVKRAYAERGIDARVYPFFDDLADLYASARLAVTTAGAVTLEELAAFGLPALLVPLRNAADNHQDFNARYFSLWTSTPWTDEMSWDEAALVARLELLLTDDAAWQAVAANMRANWRPTAAEDIARECLALLGNDQRSRCGSA